MKAFFESIAASALKFSSYREVVRRELGWRYIVFLTLILGIIAGIWFAAVLALGWRDAVNAFSTQVPAFTARIEKGALTVEGVPQPLVLPSEDGREVLVVDTREGATPSDIEKYDQFLFIGREKLIARQGNDVATQVREIEWKKAPDLTITKDAILQFAAKAKYWLIPLVFFFMGLLGWGGILFISIVFALFWSAVGFIGARIAKMPLTFAQVLAVAFHALTAPILVRFIFTVAGVGRVPYLFTVIFLVYFVGALAAIKKGEGDAGAAPSAPMGGAGA